MKLYALVAKWLQHVPMSSTMFPWFSSFFNAPNPNPNPNKPTKRKYPRSYLFGLVGFGPINTGDLTFYLIKYTRKTDCVLC